MASSSLWQRFQRYFLEYRDLRFSLDISRMRFPNDLFENMRPQIEQAFAAMRELEAGALANPTENRMVGHYWLRSPVLAPTAEIRSEIEDTIRRIKALLRTAIKAQPTSIHTSNKSATSSSIFLSHLWKCATIGAARGLKSRMGLRVAIILRDFCGGAAAHCARRGGN